MQCLLRHGLGAVRRVGCVRLVHQRFDLRPDLSSFADVQASYDSICGQYARSFASQQVSAKRVCPLFADGYSSTSQSVPQLESYDRV